MVTILAGITIVFTMAWYVTSLLRRASAALRHAIWTCAFGAVLMLAPLRLTMPHRVVAVLPSADITTTVISSAPTAASFTLATFLLGVWAFGTAVLTLRLLINAMRLRRIVLSASGAGRVLTSPRVRGPLVAGVFRPVILLPENAATWTISRRRAVLAHEAAHIRRRDPAILMAAQIAIAFYWFHPLCWIAAARLRAESERACDDAALRLGIRGSDYATHLLELARRFHNQLAIPMAATAHLESRVISILNPKTNRSFAGRACWLATAALSALVLAPITTFTVRAQQPAAPDQTLFDRAIRSIDRGDYGGARLTLNTLINAYESSEYLVWAKLAIADSWFREGGRTGLAQADAEYKDFALFYPNVAEIRNRVVVGTQGATVRSGGIVPGPVAISQANPVYPAGLRAQGIDGSVLVAVAISKAGVPGSLKVLNIPGHTEFAAAAVEAVGQWRFRPAPAEVLTTIEVDFRH